MKLLSENLEAKNKLKIWKAMSAMKNFQIKAYLHLFFFHCWFFTFTYLFIYKKFTSFTVTKIA